MLADCIGRYTRGFYLFREIGFLHAIIDSEKFVKKTREGLQLKSFSRLVIRLGLEPKTPTLKVLCSTC